MPFWTAFSQIDFGYSERMPVSAAALSVRKDVRPAVSEFPVTDRSFGDIDAKGHAGRYHTYQCCSNPSLTGFEEGGKGATDTAQGSYRLRPVRVFDLCLLASSISYAVIAGLPNHEASQWWYSHYMVDVLLWM